MKAVEARRNDAQTPKLSIRKVAVEYRVPKSTLHDTLRYRVSGKQGRQQELTEDEESTILRTGLSFSDGGIPMVRERVAPCPHFDILERLVSNHAIDGARIWNLDGTRGTHC